ncbi:MAG TPA: HlyD family efflux transporter periplasmic adaptor subunit [Candidatus Melainabacteria bacterium]|jgi:multidrug efflux pump subunit AcrA (membrane-fusion protein)|nr:HlyD family efflux transporter periplasmic adaptor subunit [Candidatus Melainabacteria bacterium]HIN63059.1 HlyD family efflux transporter periplasmic adaptor subunit [Candidatus Obscuribacterales bacterium]
MPIQANESEIEAPNKTGFAASVRKNLWGVITLTVVTVVCVVIVQVFKKPGQMSVLESQAMDMTVMVPPKGALPVGIAAVKREQISGSVTYTGTVQAYTDEDVYPRVTGRVVKMAVYPGDIVKAGQLLVQLDPAEKSEYAAKRQEAQSAEDAAMHNAGIAKSEFAQKKYELEAAKQAEKGAQKALAEANANLAYWKPEIERQSALLKSQVVSLDEYQKELAQMKVAEAQAEQAQAKVDESKNTKLAAQAALDTMIHHIGHQYSAAEQATAALKNTLIYEKYTTISAQEDGVVTKRLISPGVVVSPGMMLLKVAHVKQVRVQAEVASEDAERIELGSKVLIKGSQTKSDDIEARVTAIFPAADPASRTVTVEALINNIRTLNRVGERQVGSIGMYRFLPGQYVVMKILTGEHEGLTVPSSAIIWREGKSQVWKTGTAANFANKAKYQCPMHPEVISDKPGTCPKCNMTLQPVQGAKESAPVKKQYTCTMHPEVITDAPGKCPKCGMDLVPKELGGKNEAQLVNIEIGLANPDRTEIIRGLSEGDQVVYAGYSSLQPGMSVVAAEWGKTGPAKLPTASEVQGNRLDASNNWTHEEMAGSFMIKVSLDPAKGGSNNTIVKVEKHGGGVISGAQVSAKTSMPGMGDMAGPDLNGATGMNGEARLKSDLSSGLWRLKLKISPPQAPAIESSVDVEVP